MAGRLVDLSAPGTPIPNPIAVDSNVVIAGMLASYPGQSRIDFSRAAVFFERLRSNGQQVIITPTAYSEVIHADIRLTYQHARARHRNALASHYGRTGGFSWLDLYKLDPTVLQQRAGALEQLRQRLIASNLVLLSPHDLGSISSGRPYDEELLELVCCYGLDTSDATILMEAARIDVFEMVSFDRDMRRSLIDFDVYTWL